MSHSDVEGVEANDSGQRDARGGALARRQDGVMSLAPLYHRRTRDAVNALAYFITSTSRLYVDFPSIFQRAPQGLVHTGDGIFDTRVLTSPPHADS